MKNFKTNYSTLLCSSLLLNAGRNIANSIFNNFDDKHREWYKWKIKIK
ncbi:hypothetical protein [Fusobacterium ulcerans]|nr:hypothetical protein [Fusobacterium ulcerans]BBA52085.1 hypothetical protein FV113G1_24350 [Fusobacterium varium]